MDFSFRITGRCVLLYLCRRVHLSNILQYHDSNTEGLNLEQHLNWISRLHKNSCTSKENTDT